ncbi:YqjF family protein [Leifsonia sp. AG29]|uniref:YqjF family protein n=1 Tax=Leifsonia sp. AG29 TaxID=2598860 RepID=UPI001E308129|nr:DUF2071 domain-containing protein [Leifsonia sp. AG29]
MTPEPQTPEPVTPERSTALTGVWTRQTWSDAAFVHWAVDPSVVDRFFPAGVRPDTVDGRTHVGLIAFRMQRLGAPRGPGIPYFGDFLETNVRLYSVDREGRRGVVFVSLDASRLVPVLGARAALALPYMWSRMRASRRGSVLEYRSARHVTGAASSRLVLDIGQPIAEPMALDHHLTARWALHVRAWGRTVSVPNQHPRWPLQRATLLACDDGLLTAAGLPSPEDPPVSVLYSPGVTTVFGRPEVLRPV